MGIVNPDKDNFRDKISTVDKQGKRVWIYPKKPSGRYHRARAVVAVVLLAILFMGPFIKIGGKPLLLLNILEREFVIFGMTFWPQDFHLFVLGTIAMVVFIVLFTVVYGRVWCGWACPQTIFMEMVFRKIEYWIEGDAHKQKALNLAPWTGEKVFKKGLKHSIFYTISFLIGNTFLAYIIGTEKLIEIITDPPSEHLAGLTAMIIFSTIFYWVFASFREQVCTLVCPYGRLQGVLLDKDSVVVHYDFERGEPRERMKRGAIQENAGDCVMCNQCVEVCPTGIDIRNGTQLECVNCTACMDACDYVMDKVNRPRGLIRYASYNGILNKVPLKFNARMFGYSAVLVLLVAILSFLMITRSDVETTILRTPGVLYQQTDEGNYTNLYNVKIVNKTSMNLPVNLRLKQPAGKIKLVGGELVVPETGMVEAAFFIELQPKVIFTPNLPVLIEIISGDEVIEEIRSSFVGPKIK